MIEAVVQTAKFETSYRRSGSGTPVVLLEGNGLPGGAESLFHSLAVRFRAIAPVLPPGLGEATTESARLLEMWLRGLIDGLGLERPALVSDAVHGPAILRFAALDPDRLQRVVLVRRGGERWCADSASRRTMDGPADAGPQPVLLCRLPPGAEGAGRAAAETEILEFLARSR